VTSTVAAPAQRTIADILTAVPTGLVIGGRVVPAANRFYVHRGIAAAFTDRLTAQMSALRLGPGDNETTQLGPLITATARTEISGLVQGALAEGATLTTGGTVPAGDGFYYPATVLADVPADAVILRAEIFGPVAPSSPSTVRTRRSGWLTTPRSGWSPTSTAVTWRAACGSVSGSSPAWSDSTGAWCRIRPPRSAE